MNEVLNIALLVYVLEAGFLVLSFGLGFISGLKL